MFKDKFYLQFSATLFLSGTIFFSGCFSVKTKVEKPVLPKLETATQAQLKDEINRFARINSMRAKMDLKFEDNSFAELGVAEQYRSADGEIVVQRPANILLKIQVPFVKSDIVQMTSDGTHFRVAVIEDGAGGKFRNFVLGTNNADYSKLQEAVGVMNVADDREREIRKNAKAFSNLRPQHFTEAILMNPVDGEKLYVQSEFFQEEFDPMARKKSPIARIMRGYYLLDELVKNADGSLSLSRRFWFDRVGLIRLARQQIYDVQGNLDSDITYGKEARFTENGEYSLPLRIEVIRPKEKYKMSLTHQTPEAVSVGKTYNADVFILQNRWNLPEVDLDKKIQGR